MWPWSRRRTGEGWTAVTVAGQRICVARVQRRSGRPAVAAWESFAREGSPVEILKRLRSGGRLDGGACVLSLPPGDYHLVQVDAPAVPENEWRDAVRWQIRDMVDFPVADAGIDCLPIPVTGGGRRDQVYVAAASREVLAVWAQAFQDAGVPLDAIDLPEFAQRNVAALFEDDNRALALLAFDDSRGRLTFTWRGELYFVRHIEVAPGELAGGGAAFERVLLDVQRTLDNVERSFGAVSVSRLLVAGVPGAPGFIDYLKGNLYQPVDALDLAERLDLTAVPALVAPDRQGAALIAIGAALREAEAQTS